MTTPAAIVGMLVDARNTAQKNVRLTIDVPVDHALEVIETFGWPTPATPVMVAITRMKESEVVPVDAKRRDREARVAWHNLGPTQQAGILCNDNQFAAFIGDRYPELAAPTLADAVREICGVASRAELATDHRARVLWHQLLSEFRAWEIEPQVIG